MSPTGQHFASCLPGYTAEVPPIPAAITRGSQLTLRAKGRHLADLDEVLVRQWPAGKLSDLATDRERSKIEANEADPVDECRYLGLRCVVVAEENSTRRPPSALGSSANTSARR
jgi:hypothetical protein